MLAFLRGFVARHRKAKLAEHRAICLAAYRAARQAKDTRRQHETFDRARAATLQVLQAELRR